MFTLNEQVDLSWAHRHHLGRHRGAMDEQLGSPILVLIVCTGRQR